MNLSKFKKLSLRTQFSVLAVGLLVFGVFVTVRGSQQNQENRSRAATGNCTTFNASAENLVADDCTVPSGMNMSIFGNNNTIQGGLGGNINGNGNLIMGGENGSIFGSGNEVCGGLNGGITGNNNIIHGPVGGPINGTGNQVNFTGPCGVIRQPSQPPTAPPSQPPATCADGIDNNQNELIDGQDPACHTDGDPQNPGTYDPTRNEGPTPSITQRPTITSGPTVTPGVTVLPSISVAPGNTSFRLTLLLHGIGKGGDSANPNSGGNENPNHTQRDVAVEVFNSQNVLVVNKTGTVNFNSADGNFQGTIDMGNTLTTGVYTVKVKSTQFLKTIVPGIQNITAGQANQMPTTTLVTGDINSDNTINILDYNILAGCYSDFEPAADCTAANKLLADLYDDGDVNQFDYNLFLRELANRQGQ